MRNVKEFIQTGKDVVRVVLLILFAVSLVSCGEPLPLSDDRVHVCERLVSPDGLKIAIRWGMSDYDCSPCEVSRISVVPSGDPDVDLRKYLLPSRYISASWADDNSLTARIDLIPCLQGLAECNTDSEVRFGTVINVELDDGIGGRRMDVIRRRTSPDGKLDFIAYRYPEPGRKHQIHISVVPAGESVPKHGNYYIGHCGADGLLDGKWASPDTLLFKTSPTESYFCQWGFIENPYGVSHRVVVDRKLEGCTAWIEKRGLFWWVR